MIKQSNNNSRCPGKRHALNFHHLTPRAHVVAVTSPVASELDWARENLEGAQTYLDFDEMLEQKDIDAVVVSTITAVHAKQTLAAIARGYHVLCEKPLSLEAQIVRPTLSVSSPIFRIDLVQCSGAVNCRRIQRIP